MRLLALLGVVLGILRSAVPASAGDADAVMAALKDEAAECRYLQALCDEAHTALAVFSTAADRYTHEVKYGIANGYEAHVYEAQALTAEEGFVRATRNYKNAVDVLRAKHVKPPTCMQACR